MNRKPFDNNLAGCIATGKIPTNNIKQLVISLDGRN
jgi:hypothetical protein